MFPPFRRRDSFITHRAFCDALSEENNKAKQDMTTQTSSMARNLQDQVPGDVSSSNIPATNNNAIGFTPNLTEERKITPLRPISRNELVMLPNLLKSPGMVMAGAMFSNGPASLLTPSLQQGGGTATASFTDHNSNSAREAAIMGPSSSSAHTSATALLLKAAQMGATASNGNIAPPMMHRSFIPGVGGYGNNTRSMDQLHAGPFGCHGVSHANSSEAVVLDGVSELTFFDAPVYDSWPMMMEKLELASDLSGNRSSNSLVMGRNMGMDGLVTRPGDGGGTVQARINGAGDVTTVDFLGMGGTSSLGLNEQQERGMHHLDSLQFSGAGGSILEKPLWDV